MLPFGLVLLVLFGLALGPNRQVLANVAAGLFWVAVLLATILAVQRSFAIESADDPRDGLRLSGLDPAGVFCGKALAIAVQLVALEIVLAIAGALLFDVRLQGALELIGVRGGDGGARCGRHRLRRRGGGRAGSSRRSSPCCSSRSSRRCSSPP